MIPWYVSIIQSTSKPGVTYKIPCVAALGTFKIRQVLSTIGLDRKYAFEPHVAGTLNNATAPLALDKERIKQLQTRAIRAAGLEGGKFSSKNKASSFLNNQARDGTSIKQSRRMYGVYVVKEPTIDGVIASPAVNCLSSMRNSADVEEYVVTAVSVMCNPPMVTEHRGAMASGDKAGGNPAASLFGRSDTLIMKFQNDMQKAAANRAFVQAHNDARRADEDAKNRDGGAYVPLFNSNSRKRQLVRRGPNYTTNFHDVPPGNTIVHQQMPTIPTATAKELNVNAMETIAREFGVPAPMLTGDSGRIAANVEQSQSILDTYAFDQAAIIAIATSWILNHINYKEDTAELQLMYTLSKAANEKTPSAKAERKLLKSNLNMVSRYNVRVSRPPALASQVIEIADRGHFPRKVEGALLAAAANIPSALLKEQPWPNPYEKPEPGDKPVKPKAKPKK
jgi:hypothetical protein